MKNKIYLLLAIPFMFSCGNDRGQMEANRKRDSLNTANASLNGVVSQKDSTIDSFIRSFNEIQDNLDSIKVKEKLINLEKKPGETKDKQKQILSDIQLVYNLLGENKKKMAYINSKLNRSNAKNKDLDKMVDHLNTELAEKNGEIDDLKDQLEALDIEVSGLKIYYAEAQQESNIKTDQLNTVYYASGKSKDLIRQNVITKEGGLIGIGRTPELKDNFNKDRFTKADASELTEIPLRGKRAKVVTSQPSTSYRFEGEQGKQINKLVITSSADFWELQSILLLFVTKKQHIANNLNGKMPRKHKTRRN